MRNSAIAAAAITAVSALSLIFVFSRPADQVSQTPTTTAMPRTSQQTQTTTIDGEQRITNQVGEVLVKNPLGSATNTSLTFQPPYVKVVLDVNNTVVWVNDDITLHTVTSTTSLFDYVLQPGQSASFTFTQPGRYEYVCTAHPWMKGVVEVLVRS